MDQDWDMKQRFNIVTLFYGMSSRYTDVTSNSPDEILINNRNCDIPRKILAVGSELKEQLNIEISKALLTKRGMKIHNNYRHLLIYESGCVIEMIHNLTCLATKQKFQKYDNNYKNSMKYCGMTVGKNSNTGIKYRMLKHVTGDDELSIGGCLSAGAQGRDDVFNSALVSVDSFDIKYSYHLELHDECFVKLKHKLMSFDAFKIKYYKKHLHKIHNGAIENMELYICTYLTKLSLNSENVASNPMILVTNSKIESKAGEHMGGIPSETIIAN